MIYRIFHPSPILSDVIDHYWYVSSQQEIQGQQYFYTPILQVLAFSFKKQEEYHVVCGKTFTLNKNTYLFGQGTGPRITTATTSEYEYLGVKFKPLGIAKITGINMEHLVNQIIDVDDLWGNELELLWDEMQSMISIESTINVLEKFLVKKYLTVSVNKKMDCTQNALTLIKLTQGNISVKTLQEQTNTSRKTLERAFVQNLGILPKLFCSIVLFNTAKHRLDMMNKDENLTSIALDLGYYDSSHFTSEFKRFSSLTPSGYLKNNKSGFVFKDL